MTNAEIAEQLTFQLDRYKADPAAAAQNGALRGVNDGILKGLKALGVNPYAADVLPARNIDYGNPKFVEGVEALIAELIG